MKPCLEACKYNAIDLGMKPETISLNVGAVVLATGWDPYDMKKLDLLGGGSVKNVITNMMMERIASSDGPTQNVFVSPSFRKIAFGVTVALMLTAVLHKGHDSAGTDSFIHFIVASDIKQDDLFFCDHQGQRNPVTIGQADGIAVLQPAAEAVQIKMGLKRVLPHVIDGLRELLLENADAS